ncbi:MAG TPA: ABC transporter substrate binding protein [Burkholderiales bacterium]|nr:ABC transporter substrate binding protein [Burkholderiales bacterium]
MAASQFDRRRFLKASAAASGAAAVASYIRTSHAGSPLSVGFWDHWVPGANAVLIKLCNEWSKKEKVDLKIDYFPDQGGKLALIGIAEAQAKSGHDILAFPTWFAAAQTGNLEPVDDIMGSLIASNGKVLPAVEGVGKQNGHWIAVPATPGSQMLAACARIDLFKQHVGLDIPGMYPANAPPDSSLTDQWTWDTFLMAAEKCFKAGYPFGLGLGQTGDSVDWVSALFASYGAELVDASGNVTVDSNATRQALEYVKQLVRFLPRDVFTWDDTSNNRWLVEGKGALIMNPPSAWAAAKRANPQLAGQLWTFPTPKGPKGRYQAARPSFWGIWKFSGNKPAAKSLLTHLSQRAAVEQLVRAGGGYDIPWFSGLRDFDVWAEEGPPKGTLTHYPPASDQTLWISGSPAPSPIAAQIYARATITKMVARYTQSGDSMDKTLAWAASELEGLIALSGFVVPAKAAAQQTGKVLRVGYLSPFTLPFEADGIHVFEQTLRERGYIQGQNLSILYQSSEGRDELLPDLASKLIGLHIDALVTFGAVATRAAQQMTHSVPIVMVTVLDPVQAGFVDSLSRPGGNITGSSDLSEELVAKRVELLKQTIPTASLIAVLWDPTGPTNALDLRRTEAAAAALGMKVRAAAAHDRNEIEKAFADMKQWRPQALMVLMSSPAIVHIVRILELANGARLPTMYGTRGAAMAGALLSYGPDLADQYRRAAVFVEKILKGAKPADLPVERPTRFELVVNLKTAKALDITIPQSILLQANEVIR